MACTSDSGTNGNGTPKIMLSFSDVSDSPVGLSDLAVCRIIPAVIVALGSQNAGESS